MTFECCTLKLFPRGGCLTDLQIYSSDLHSRIDPPPRKQFQGTDFKKRGGVKRVLDLGGARVGAQASNLSAQSSSHPLTCGAK